MPNADNRDINKRKTKDRTSGAFLKDSEVEVNCLLNFDNL